MNNDTIDVRLDVVDGVVPIQEIILILNNVEIKGTFNGVEFVGIFENYRKVDADILTCSCGHSGCAGIFYGTTVKRRRYTVEWRDIDCGLPKRFYKFNLSEYKTAIDKTYEMLYFISQSREQIATPDQYYWTSYDSVASLKDVLGLYKNPQYIDWRVKNGIPI